MIRLLLVCIFLGFGSSLIGSTDASYYELNEKARASYKNLMSLNIEDARASIQSLQKEQPANYSALHLANYADFLELIITENEALYNRRLIERAVRIRQIENASEPGESPYYNYTLGEIHLQWAIIKFKFQDYYSGFRDASKAYKFFKKNQEAYPDFILNNKGIGTIETLVGVIPENLRWGVRLLGGLRGDIPTGLQKLKSVHEQLDQDDLFKKETGIIYAYLLLHYGNKKSQSWDVLETLNLDPTNPTELFIKANLAHYVGKNDLAIEMLTSYSQKPKAMRFDYLNYMLGVAKLNRLDPDADHYLQIYVKQFKGQYYIKDAYLRLAWHDLVHGDLLGYDRNIQLVKSKGTSDIDFDKTALRYAKEKEVPEASLLKARLLYDGGYYQKADELLSILEKYKLKSDQDKVEYTYRLGRIRQQLSEYKSAVKLFRETIALGSKHASHYACNSALQIGLIYEDQGASKEAIEAYKSCLRINPSDYKQSLHHKAKVGIQRLQ